MSAFDEFITQLGGNTPAPAAAEDLPDDKYIDTPEGMDADYRKKHRNASAFYPLIDRYAKEYPDVPELAQYAKAVMLRESSGNPEATSSTGARGLFQFMPDTWTDMGGDPNKITDPMENIPRGVKYLAQQYQDFGDWNEALAAYNWGPTRVARNGIDVLPHETANYLKAVNAYKRRLKPSSLESMFQNADNPNAGQGMDADVNFNNFIASQTQAPSLDTFQQQGPISLAQAQPVAKGLPALQPAPQEQGVEPAPLPTPFTTEAATEIAKTPPLYGYQIPQKPTPEQNFQTMSENAPINATEAGEGVVKGMVRGATANLVKPPISARQAPYGEMGQLMGGMAPMALGPLGAEAAAAGMASQAFLQNAKPDTEGGAGIQNPIETTVQTALASVLGSVGPGAMPNMLKRIGAGAGLGAVQGIASSVTQKIAQLANEGKVDLANQEDVKNLAISMLQGAIFAGHGGEGGEHIAAPEIRHVNEGPAPVQPERGKIQHPGELAQPIPNPSFTDRSAQEALQNTQTKFTSYDPEGRREPPINVPQEPVPQDQAGATPQGDPNMQREAFLKQAEKYLGPEKANAFKVLMGEYLPGGKNAVPYNVKLQNVPAVAPLGSASASDLNAKNSSSSEANASQANLAYEGAGTPGTPDAMTSDPSLRTNTWMGNRPTRQNEDLSLRNTEGGAQEPMSDNVAPAPEEVKRTPFELKDLDKQPDQLPTLRERIRSILQNQKIYVDDETKAQLGISKGGARELGPIFTKDKQNGLSFDKVAEMIREQAQNGSEHFRGIGDGRNVEANDVIDALFSGNQEYQKPKSNEPDHVAATNDFLRNGNADFEGATPTAARTLGDEFDAGGMKFKRIGAKDKSRIAYKDEYGGKYDFHPDEMVHVGGEMKAPETPKETAAATTPDENDGRYFQKGPPKTNQEDMFGNKGRVASEGLIKGKGEDKGLEGTPLFDGEKRQEQAKAEEDQQRLFQKDEEKKAPPFYSQLRKVIEEKMPGAAGPEAIKGLVKANAVKDEEMKWSGLDDLLKTKEGQKLSKKEVLDHLDQNQVQIKEVQSGSLKSKDTYRVEDHPFDNGYYIAHHNEAGGFLGDVGERTYPTREEAEAAADEMRDRKLKTPTKYENYQEPGGKNYRELLLTLPDPKQAAHAKRLKEHSDKMTAAWDARDHDLYRRLDNEYADMHAPGVDPAFKSSHWSEPNVLAHVRFNDRTTPEGKKVLHLEEVQSDWHQAGRKKGYRPREGRKPTQAEAKEFFGIEDESWAKMDNELRESYVNEYMEGGAHLRGGSEVPDAPFKKTWHEMALRRMLRYAAENGYDYLSWTGGEKQADRYSLSKHLDHVIATKSAIRDTVNIRAFEKNGHQVFSEIVPADKVSDYVGKDLAEKIAAQEPGNEARYSGLDLKVGGEGMTGFYDKMIPDYLSKYGKKWGARVEKLSDQAMPWEVVSGNGNQRRFRTEAEAKAAADPDYLDFVRHSPDTPEAKGLPFQAIPITDAMRKSVLEEGQPLFQGKPENEIKGYTDFNAAKKEFTISLVDGKADVSTLFHEFFHVLEQGGVVTKADRAILTRALEAHGITDALNAKGVFKEAAAEKVADWWERYLRDGKSPVKELQRVFDKVRNWMIEVYRGIKGTRLEDRVPHSVRAVFDRIIEGGRQAEGAHPEEGRLAQKSGKATKPTEQMVGPNAPRNQKGSDDEEFMVNEAKAGKKESGYLGKLEKALFEHGDRGYPIKKIQKIYEMEYNFHVRSDDNLNYAINRIYGAAGSANHYIDKNLAPAIEGGKIGDQTFERLAPAESKRLFEYLLSRDALWRFDNAEDYKMPRNLSKERAMKIVKEHKDLAAKDPALYAKLEKAGDAMVNYARDLALKKLEMGLWTQKDFEESTKNPVYIPEIRYWAEKLAVGKKPGIGLAFATKMRLLRGTHASDEDVRVFNPLASLIHDTHQLALEGAKHYLGNAIIDMQESSPELQKLITEQEDGYQIKAHEGTFPVRRPRTTELPPEVEKFAEEYQKALYTIKLDEDYVPGSTKEDQILERHRAKIEERIAALPPNKRNLLAGDMKDIIDRVEANRQKFNKKRAEEAYATQAKFKALPAEQQKLIKRWMREGQVTNYTVPIELAQAMNSMDPIDYGSLGRILKGATTIFKKGTVTWNPAFAFVNSGRDVQEAYLNTGTPHHYALKGWHDFITESDMYDKYMERGGAIGSSESGFKGSTTKAQDITYGRRPIKDRLNKLKDPAAWKDKKKIIGGKEFSYKQLARFAELASHGVKMPLEAMEALGHMSEMSTRLGVMRYGMDKLGMNVDEAVDMARHATLDFDQRGGGIGTQILLDIVPFVNPRIQGVLRTARRFQENPKKAAATMFLAGVLPQLGLTALNMLNPNYANVSDRDKRNSWVIMVPGRDKPILIPKPFPVQMVLNPFQMAFEKAVGTAFTSNRDMVRDDLQEIMPVSDLPSLLPPLLKVMIENGIGQGGMDLYFNRPIVKEPGREPVDQYDPRTSETMKRVAEKLQWLPDQVEWLKSPERLQHFSNAALGGTADNLLFLTDMLLGDPKKVLRSDYLPVINRFYKSAEEWQGGLANQQRQLLSEIKLKQRSAGSSIEAQQLARKGEKVDSKAMTTRIHHTAEALHNKITELGSVNLEMARVRELVQAVRDHNPNVEYHFLRPPTLKKPATPAPSGATPEVSPAPEDATLPSTSETGSEEAP